MSSSDSLHIPGSGHYRRSISAEELARLPKQKWDGFSHIIANVDVAHQAVAHILRHCRKSARVEPRDAMIGLDVWCVSSTNTSPFCRCQFPVVLQVATSTRVYTFPLTSVGKTQGGGKSGTFAILEPLLAAPDVFKCFIGGNVIEIFSQDDCMGRQQLRGFIDLAPLAERGGFLQQSLEAMSGLLLGHTFCQQPQETDMGHDDRLITLGQPGTRAWIAREVALKLAPLWLPL